MELHAPSHLFLVWKFMSWTQHSCLRLCFTSWRTRLRVTLNSRICQNCHEWLATDQRWDTSGEKSLLELPRWNKLLRGVNVLGRSHNYDSPEPATRKSTIHTCRSFGIGKVQSSSQKLRVLTRHPLHNWRDGISMQPSQQQQRLHTPATPASAHTHKQKQKKLLIFCRILFIFPNCLKERKCHIRTLSVLRD